MKPSAFLSAFLACCGVVALSEVRKFSVLSEPVELRYGEVHNKMQVGSNGTGLPLPEDVVSRYANGEKRMAITGFDVDLIRLGPDGEETQVKLSDHYLHHYILYFGASDSMQRMINLTLHDEHAAHKITGCDGMKGAGLQMLKDLGSGIKRVGFGSAAGAEYRHNPQRFPEPFRLILEKPETLAPVIHTINTNSADNRTNGSISGTTKKASVSRLVECPCTPQRKIDPEAGTIDGKKAVPPIQCSEAFEATGNPSCHLSTYQGGWRCCEHGMFVIDTATECDTPSCEEKVTDKIYMKFTFYYEDVLPTTRNMETSACCDVTSDRQGTQNIEYDVVPCPSGAAPEACVHVAESMQPIGFYDSSSGDYKGSDLVDLVFAAPHLHLGGNSMTLVDPQTNKTLCEVHRTPDNSAGITYGDGPEPGNEDGYLVGLRPCTWRGEEAPRFRRDHLLRSLAVYNATTPHTGVMGLWLIQVSAVPDPILV